MQHRHPSPSPLLIAAIATAIAILGTSSQAGAGKRPIGSTAPVSSVLPAPARLRLDDDAPIRFPLLARYARPGVSPHGYGLVHSAFDEDCGGGSWTALSRYRVTPELESWLPMAAATLAPRASRCAIQPDFAGGTAWLTGDRTVAAFPWASANDTLTMMSPVAQGTSALVFRALDPATPACQRRAVGFSRYGAEPDRFPLLGCDGSVDGEAIDRLSLMARPPGVARPPLPLPDEPAPDSVRGEWMPSIKLVHPRLVWLVAQIAKAFPGRTFYIVSGYRIGAHEGKHGEARGLDLSVAGIPNDQLYKFCRKQHDAGCGYYPNHNFVHVDVRPEGSGGSYWIDVSLPGEKSVYVDSWPGVEEKPGANWTMDGDR